jgi:glycosyltransferase involved in cell wall biosynthesis
MLKSKKYRIWGVCTDTITRNGKVVLKKGKKIFGAVGWYRIVNPLTKLGAEIDIGIGLTSHPHDVIKEGKRCLGALSMKEKGDIWFMKMSDNEDIDHIYGTNRDFTGAKLVLDLDDDPNTVDPRHPDYEKLKDRFHMWDRMIRLADHIVVSTEEIKQSIKHQNPYVTVIPNAIDPDIWKFKKKEWKDGKIRIGWITSGSHFVDSPLLDNVMDELIAKYPNVEFHMAGLMMNDCYGKGWFHHKGTLGYKKFPKFYADLGWDIAIAPLKDIKFNKAKSNIKFLEASMLKIPIVASDVTPYQCIQHGKTGYLASNPAQFKKYLELLIENEELRRKVGENAYQYVMDNWTIDKFLPMYEHLFEKLMDKKDITVVTAIAGGKDELLPQPEYKGVEYVAFTEEVKDSQWKTRKVCDKFVKPVMNAKIHKILTHKYVDTPYIVWMDGNCQLKQDPHELVKLMGDKDFAFFKHPGWDSVYREAERCIELKKGDVSEIAEQVRVYAKDNFPEPSPHCELTCFIRKNNPKANDLFEKWWVEITRYSERDQISFPVVFKGQDWETIPGSVVNGKDFKLNAEDTKKFPGNDYFNYFKHNK